MTTRTITRNELFALMTACYFAPAEASQNGRGIPGLLSGAPGIGKTSLVREFARTVEGCDFEHFAVGLRGEGALGVTPVYSEDADAITYPAAQWAAPYLVKGTRALVLVDELNTAEESLQAPLLALVLDKQLGADKFGPGVRFFGAQNPVGQGGANSHEIAPALANRFCHLPEVKVDVSELGAHFDAWTPYTAEALDDDFASAEAGEVIDADEIEARIDAEFVEVKARWARVVTAFLTRMPQFVHNMPEEMDEAASQAWASPRSWKMALSLICTAEILGLTDELRDMLVEGCVGTAATVAFVEYASKLDLPDTLELLDGAIDWKPTPTRPDITGAVLADVCRVLRDRGLDNRMQRAEAAWDLLGTVAATNAELVNRPGRELMARRLFNPAWSGVKAVHKATGSMLTVAGMLKRK